MIEKQTITKTTGKNCANCTHFGMSIIDYGDDVGANCLKTNCEWDSQLNPSKGDDDKIYSIDRPGGQVCALWEKCAEDDGEY